MLVEQLAVFLENKSGRLAEITAVLAQNNINIRALRYTRWKTPAE